jgi:hypothetical protein
MYFPKNRIKTGLISNGNLLVKSTSEEYYGPYFETYTGKYYAGKSPDYANLIELIISNNSTSKATINASKGEVDSDERFYPGNNASYTSQRNLPANPPIPSPPKYSRTEPTSRDYINGEYSKYFAKKTNEYIYLEISKEDYNKLKNQDPTILWPLYNCLYMQYSLNSQNINKTLVANIERNNQWYGFFNYMTRYYFKETQENLFTRGGEYVTEQGENYIGPYHIHPSKGPMVGAKHVSSPHGFLYKIGQITGSLDATSTTQYSSTTSPSIGGSTGGGGGGGY